MRLNHNSMAHTANNNLAGINNNLTLSMQRLSSGYKVNKSSDDPAAKAISQRMNSQLRGLARAENNANDGISLIQTAEGALDEIHSILARIRELAVRGANEVYAEEDKDAMQDEIDQLREELDRISETTDFNGRKLLNGELNKKGYTDSDALKVVEIGGDIEPGEYGLTVSALGEQAKSSITPLAAGKVISKSEEGTLLINNFEIRIKEGMTATEVNEKIRNATSKIGIDYYENTGDLISQEYGTKQRITVKASNEELEALFGADGSTAYGKDAEASFGADRVGFSETATVEAQGNRITVTDKDGFKMVYDIDPDATEDNGVGGIEEVDATITVLSAGPMVLQIGNNEGQTLNVNINKTTAESLEIEHINVYTNGYASEAIEKIDAAVAKISGIRSALGAYQNRLDHTVTNLESSSENLTSAVSRIQDTDMAEEITEYSQQNVLSQSALQMLLKSNARPEGLLQLFQR
ncbi:MAG: flagellin [Clostridium sp.]|nr:flagellin [Clostridium sp.]